MAPIKARTIFVLVVFFTAGVSECHKMPFLQDCPSNCTCTSSRYRRFTIEWTNRSVEEPGSSSTDISKLLRSDPFVDLRYQNITIDCTNRSVEEPGSLSADINDLLSSDPFVDLRSLTITNSPLSEVPRSVCNLTQLRALILDENRLTRLPGDCLTGLPQLEHLSATGNIIDILQAGVLEGAEKLLTLLMQNNRIVAIDANVFRHKTELKTVNLTNNCLQTLDVWPLMLSAYQLASHRVSISMMRNNISRFTNADGWRRNWTDTKINLRLNLNFNKISHAVDILNGWNLTVDDFKVLTKTTRSQNRKPMLDLSIHNNELNCDCADYDLYILEKQTGFSHIFLEEICHLPKNLQGELIRNVPPEKFVCSLKQDCPGKCKCAYRPYNTTLHAYCSNRNLSSLPITLPKIPVAQPRYYIDVSHNSRLRHLEHRTYLNNTAIIRVSYSYVGTIDLLAWGMVLQIREVYLNNNNLKNIPANVSSLPVLGRKLVLGYNHWNCSCQNQWMKNWIIKHKQNIYDRQSLHCYTPQRLFGKSIIQVPDEDFCSDPAQRLLKKFCIATVSILGGLVLVLSIAVFMAHRMRLKLFIRWKFHPFDRDECANEDMEYDVFLSCSSDDPERYINGIIARLKSVGYKVCYHEHDFRPGDTIENNICHAIVHSKRTVCFMTSNFLKSGICMREFDLALHHNITVLRKKRLVVLMMLPNIESFVEPTECNSADDGTKTKSATDSLRQFLRQYTYIDYTASDWMDRLLYALPIKGMLSKPNSCNNNPTEATRLLDGN